MKRTLVPMVMIVVVILSLMIGGCATTGSQMPTGGYSFVFNPGDHLSRLIKERKFLEAEEVYNREIAFFEKNPDKYHKILDNLAAELNSILSPDLESLVSQMSAISWPAPIENWRGIASLIAKSKDFLDRYNSRLIFKSAERRLPLADKLAARQSQIQNAIMQDAAKMFAKYPIHAANFFEVYPAKLNEKEFLKQNIKSLLDRLVGADKDKIKRAYDLYGRYADEKGCEFIGMEYFRAALREQCGAQKPTFCQIIKAAKETISCKLILKAIPDCKIKFIDLTSSALLKKGEIEFPVAINVDLPFPTQKISPDAGISVSDFRGSEMLIIVDTPFTQASREIFRRDVVKSEFQSSLRTEPNPEYNIMQNIVNIARQEVMRAQIEKTSVDNQYCYGWGCIAKGIAQVAAATVVVKKEIELRQAMANLSQTPMTLEVPVYSPYQFNRMGIRASKAMTVNYYLIDFVAKTYYAGTFDASQKNDFTVVYGIHDNDRNYRSNLSGSNIEGDVAKFEETAINVDLSRIIERSLSDISNYKPLTGYEQVISNILERKNRVLAELAKKRFDTKPAADDKRFQSVVVVHHPGGTSGGGFFVRDDLVITNFHIIEGAKFIEMKMFNGQETFGKVIESDIRLDLALIKTQSRGNPVVLYDNQILPLGETVEAIGHPKGLEFSITRGIISGLRELPSNYAPGGKPIRFVQTDAAMSPGNSGGPLFLNNKVIGVNTQKLASIAVEGLGFAIHYSELADFLSRVTKNDWSQAPPQVQTPPPRSERPLQVKKITEERVVSAAEYNNRGFELHKNAQYKQAIENFTIALSMENNSSYYINRGSSFYELKQYDNAISDFKQAINLAPNEAGPYAWCGNVYYAKNSYGEASEYFSKAIAIAPNNAVLYLNRGHAQFKIGNKSTAASDFKKACELGNEEGCKQLKLKFP
jgi:serine protease Do